MQIDVVTLFPEWFDWFRSQRHVRNALEHGHEMRTLDSRSGTPWRRSTSALRRR